MNRKDFKIFSIDLNEKQYEFLVIGEKLCEPLERVAPRNWPALEAACAQLGFAISW